MKKAFTLLTILLACVFAKAQYITGLVKDTADKANLVNTTVTLIQVKDSTLNCYVRASTAGAFTLKKPSSGSYLLLITNPNYADYVDTITVDEKLQNLGNIYLLSKRKAYEQIVIKAKIAPIRIKGDTIIYTADSFKVKDGANVEALLRKLPGIQIGKNGEITAMGENVKTVLVDGEEFFGSDPGVALKNLQANVVDKVEVFDKKSDQATFTGIDDGVKDKTINLKLKDSKKKGYFGKVEAGGGLPDNYSNQAMINAFKNKRKFAAFGIMSNTGQTALGWEESQSYGDNENGPTMTDGGGMMWSSGGGDEFNNFWGGGNGIPKNWNLGMQYNNKYNADKQSINLSYKYNKVNAIAEGRTFAQTFLPDSTWNDNSGNTTFGGKQRNALNGTIETKLDTMNTLKITFRGSQQSNENSSTAFNQSIAGNKLINENNRRVTNNSNSTTLNASALLMHKFKKKGRTASLNLSNENNQTSSDGFLVSINKYYKAGIPLFNDTTDQEKINELQKNNFYTKLSYTEPLSKKWTMELGYAYTNTRNDNNLKSLNKDATGKYTTLVPQYSNNFVFTNTNQVPSVGFSYKHKKLTLQLANQLSFYNFNQNDLSGTNDRQYKFINVFPSMSTSVKLKGNQNFRIGYNGSGTAPTLNQLQPIQDNTNPFYIVTGNPNLRQQFSHNINSSYNKYDVLTKKNMYGNFNFSTQQNAYTNFTTIDTLGRRIAKTVNVNGNFSGRANFNYGFEIKKIELGVSIGPSFSLSRRNDFVNGLANITNGSRIGVSFNFDKWVDEKWGFWSSINLLKNVNRASINSASNTSFNSASGNLSGNVHLPLKLVLEGEVEFDYRQRDPRFPQNNNLTLVNMNISREVIANEFTMKLGVNDLLNQNRGYLRNLTSYNFTETFYTTLRRFWLLTLTYKFNSQKIPKATTNVKK